MTVSDDVIRALSHTYVIIPMLNEEESIGLVLRDLPGVRQVVVVDNGSTDDGPRIASENGARVVEEPRRGYGQACLTGIEAVEQQVDQSTRDDTIVVFVDGDFSDHPEEIVNILQPIVDEGRDFVVGSRMRGNREKNAMLPQAIFGNWLACSLMRVLWGARFSDLGPFRAIRLPALRKLEMNDRNFGWTIEMQIKAVRHNLSYTEVPVSYRCRVGVSKISGTISGSIKAGYKILYTIFRYRLGFA